LNRRYKRRRPDQKKKKSYFFPEGRKQKGSCRTERKMVSRPGRGRTSCAGYQGFTSPDDRKLLIRVQLMGLNTIIPDFLCTYRLKSWSITFLNFFEADACRKNTPSSLFMTIPV
jgi:hypothetical protein